MYLFITFRIPMINIASKYQLSLLNISLFVEKNLLENRVHDKYTNGNSIFLFIIYYLK